MNLFVKLCLSGMIIWNVLRSVLEPDHKFKLCPSIKLDTENPFTIDWMNKLFRYVSVICLFSSINVFLFLIEIFFKNKTEHLSLLFPQYKPKYFHPKKSWNEITLYRNYETPCDCDDVINDDDDNVSVTVNEISFGRRTIHKNRLRSTCYNILRKFEEENIQ